MPPPPIISKTINSMLLQLCAMIITSIRSLMIESGANWSRGYYQGTKQWKNVAIGLCTEEAKSANYLRK